MLRLAKQKLESQVSNLASDKEFAEEKEVAIATSLEKIEQMLEELQSQMSEKMEKQLLKK